MEEILEKEKDYKQLVQVTSALFERGQELTVRNEEYMGQLNMLINEQQKLEQSNYQNEQLANSSKQRLMQLERINEDLERQIQD